MREIIFLPQVEGDFLEAFQYYETLSPGKGGLRFETTFKKAVQEIEAGRITHLRCFGGFHRVILSRFPYNLYYRLAGNRAIISAVLFARFDPNKIERILNRRS